MNPLESDWVESIPISSPKGEVRRGLLFLKIFDKPLPKIPN
jgi:hypothetical protein